MSEILKTEAVVLKKLDYGDSSKIITLFSEKFGKVQGIIKGARSPKSRIGAIADTLNLVNVIFYNKHGREIQLISQIDLVSNFTNLKNNLDGLKYGTAIAELFVLLIADSDEHPRLYSGLKKILEVLNSNEVNYKYVFAKFLFFLHKRNRVRTAYKSLCRVRKGIE